MPVLVVTPPTPVVTLDEAKAHLRVDHDDEDGLISGLVAAAQDEIDGPRGWLGRAVGPQTLELQLARFSAWPRLAVRLPCPPVREIVSVKHLDAGGAEQEIASTNWMLVGDELWAAPSYAWPSALALRPDAVRIRYQAGWADAASVPAPIKAALLMRVGQLYRAREGDEAPSPLAEQLLAPFRVFA
jgi:uncharacterized phiE125 gp8 family phage protein